MSDGLSPVVREFAKALSAGPDLPRLLDLFLDAVSELTQPSKSAILVADPAGRHLQVAAHRGLPPHVVESVSLSGDAGLALWLTAEGRLIQIDEAQARAADATAREIARELTLLQAVVAIPLISHGDLVAILTLGQRITGGVYTRRETEMLFTLATHLATAIRDIRVHHLLQYQKEFNERILARMSNGVITIAPDETVVILNRRAEEILGMSAREVLHKDLRVLPSPLGDLLYEALTRGRATVRSEVQLALRNLPLEVSTYPVMGDGSDPLGAVLVFEDLTAQRQLAQEKRRTEQLQLLTRIVARIPDEIKNPLVSINAFMELLGERYDDASFRQQFAGVVGRDVRRVVQIFDKLAALVNEGDYKRDIVDLRVVGEDCLTEMGAQAMPAAEGAARLLSFGDESTQKHVTVAFSHEGGPFGVSGDRTMLKKAVAYVIWYLLRKTPGPEAKIAVSVSRLEEKVRVVLASRTAEVRAEELRGIFDPIQVVQGSLLDVGPCVSQRIIEGQGGRLEARHGRGEVSFTATLVVVAA
jgi:PAS domain S-box-containing protein